MKKKQTKKMCDMGGNIPYDYNAPFNFMQTPVPTEQTPFANSYQPYNFQQPLTPDANNMQAPSQQRTKQRIGSMQQSLQQGAQAVGSVFNGAIASLPALTALIPDNSPTRRPLVPLVSNDLSYGQKNSQAIFKKGGKAKGGIKVSYDDGQTWDANTQPFLQQENMQPINTAPQSPLNMASPLPIPTNKEKKSGKVSFEKIYDKRGKQYFLPKFDNFSLNQTKQVIAQLPPTYNNTPLVETPLDYYQGTYDYIPSSDWTPTMKKGGKVEPVYVESTNDPRYKAYQDSLNAYNISNEYWNTWVNERGYTPVGSPYIENNAALVAEGLRGKAQYLSDNKNGEDDIVVPLRNKPVQPVKIGSPMQPLAPIPYSSSGNPINPQLRQPLPTPQMVPVGHHSKMYQMGKHQLSDTVTDYGMQQFANGGQLQGAGLAIEDNQFTMLSPNTIKLNGKPHSEGGQDVAFGGKTIEAEGQETLSIDPRDNSLVVSGNLYLPNTNKKFKSAFKDIGTQEAKNMKVENKATDLLSTSPKSKFSALTFNTGNVLQDAASVLSRDTAEEKQLLTDMQQYILDSSEQLGIKPEKLSQMKNGGKIKMKDGGKTGNNQAIWQAVPENRHKYVEWLQNIAAEQGIPADVIPFMQRQIFQESGYNPRAKSGKGARGVMQLMPATAKELGLNSKDLNSTSDEAVQKQIAAGVSYFKKSLDNYGGDVKLALAAYNGGPGSVDFVRKETGDNNLTGDEWVEFMSNRRNTKPTKDSNAWQNQTYDYVNNIVDTPNDAFFMGKKPSKFRKDYGYEPKDKEIIEPLTPIGVNPTPQPINVGPLSPNAAQFPAGYGPQATASTPNRRKTSLADSNKFNPLSILPEAIAALDTPDYVPPQFYDSKLLQPYSVSFQDRINQNNSSFRQVAQQLNNNPEALSVLAGQKYEADNSVLGEQFRTNQGIANQTYNQNIGILNDAELKNIQLADTQAVRMDQAKANTENRRFSALASISNKMSQNKRDNNNIRLYESMSDYRLNPQTGQVEYQGANTVFGPSLPNADNRVTKKIDPITGQVIAETVVDYPASEDAKRRLQAQRRTFKFGGIFKK